MEPAHRAFSAHHMLGVFTACRYEIPYPSAEPSSPERDLAAQGLMDTPAGIKPKVEPCEDHEQEDERSPAPLPPPAADDDWEVTPLSGDNPFFTVVLCRSQVHRPFQLAIPTRFHRHLPAAREVAVLLCRGRSWTVSYCGGGKSKKLHSAWRDFAVDNGLRVGDACVFELVSAGSSKDDVVFRVQVLRGGLPEEITSKGDTADDPLVIVD
ncbi:hypothetical protein U9M48_030123 [Paspalum notatum var. saurae]|uniref:TF-B3 domain-containing protein n=1 Tax=Paspalum notatum var. saurae TaxID=547442 RepID=A0AAQ3X2B1_PASNO